MLSYLLLFNNALNLIFLKLTPKFPRARAKQIRLHITSDKNLTSNHCLKLKTLGFSCVLK